MLSWCRLGNIPIGSFNQHICKKPPFPRRRKSIAPRSAAVDCCLRGNDARYGALSESETRPRLPGFTANPLALFGGRYCLRGLCGLHRLLGHVYKCREHSAHQHRSQQYQQGYGQHRGKTHTAPAGNLRRHILW